MGGENLIRKYSRKLCKDYRLSAREAVYIGDCPMEDIKGAVESGIKTVFVSSQFYKLEDLAQADRNQMLLHQTCKKSAKI